MALVSREELDEVISNKPHILIGNGFSTSLAPTLTYGKLMQQMLSNEIVGTALSKMGTADIETALYVLETVSKISELSDFQEIIDSLREEITNEFISLLRTIHPSKKSDVCDLQLQTCCVTLKKFDIKFTLNFDPILYWALLQSAGPWMSDGFNHTIDPKRLGWSHGASSSTWWVHGAMHHFVDYLNQISLIYKMKSGTGLEETLMHRVAQEMSRGKAPTAVLGGTSRQKLSHIRRNDYLASALRSLTEAQGPILAFGWKAASQDAHISKALEDMNVYYAVHKPDSGPGVEAEARASSRGWKTFDSHFLDFWGEKCGSCTACTLEGFNFQTFGGPT